MGSARPQQRDELEVRAAAYEALITPWPDDAYRKSLDVLRRRLESSLYTIIRPSPMFPECTYHDVREAGWSYGVLVSGFGDIVEAGKFALTSEPESPAGAVKQGEQLEVVKQQLAKLRVQNEILKSRVAEERRVAAREVQRYDQLEAHHLELQARHDELIDRINERVKAGDVLQAALISRGDGRLRMVEAYEGVVKHVGKDSVVVLFEVEDDLVEHTYESKQFLDKRLPKKGDCLAVYVLAAQVPAASQGNAQEGRGDTRSDDEARRPANVVRGPLEL